MAEEILINVDLQGENKIDNLAKKSVEAASSVSKLKSELKAAQVELDKLTSDSAQYSAALQKASDAQIQLTTAKTTATQVNRALSTAIKENIGLGSQISAVNNASKAAFDSLIATLYSYNATTDKTTANTVKVVNALEAYIGATNSVSTANQNANVTTEGLNRAAQSSSANINAAASSMTGFSSTSQMATVEFSNFIDELAKISPEGVKLRAELAKLEIQANNLAIAAENAGGSVYFQSGDDTEKVKKIQNDYAILTDKIEELNDELAEVEGRAGRAAISLGGIENPIEKSGQALGNSSKNLKLNNNLMTQFNMILRETPNFAIDARIGIMSLSNNIPYLVEALENAKKSGMTMKDLWTSLKPAIFGVQGAFLAATVALTAFSNPKFVEWLGNIFGAIPKDLKIKLELEESIVKDTQKAMEEVVKIRYNMSLASNKKELDLLKDKLVAEGIATKEQLKGLNDWKALENAAFWDEYLKNVKAVAENEYIIKKDIELRLQKELKEQYLKDIVARRNALGTGGESISLSLEIKRVRKEIEELNKEYKSFSNTFGTGESLKLNPVKFNIKPATTPKNTVKSPVIAQLYPILTQKEIDDYIKDLAERTNKAIEKEFAPGSKQQEKDKLLKSLGGLVGQLSPEQLDEQYEEILKKREEFVQKERAKFEQQMELYQSYATSLGGITDGIAGIYDARMQVIDNYYNAEAALIENSLLTEEEKNNRLAKLDAERYEKQKKLLEAQKAFRIATVAMDLASGLMGVYTRATLSTLPRPANWIQAGLEAAALTAQSISSIAQIRAQQIQAPSTSASGASGVSIGALNPTKTALTTKEENLNMIQKSGENSQSVVRVSEINDVQNRVSVRERNAQF